MKQYICKKKANFGDKRYYKNDVVPAEKIDPSRVKQLIDYGILSAVDVPEPTVEPPEPANQPESADVQQGQDEQQGESADKSDAEKPDAEKPAGKRGKK